MADVSAAQAAVERGQWQVAIDLLDDLGDGAEAADALELRALAAYGVGDFDGAVTAWEDLHLKLMLEGDRAGAGRSAAMVAMFLMMDTGLMAPVRGWLRRAERTLEGTVDAPALAWIAVIRGYERFMCGDMGAAREHSARAIDLGNRLGVLPAVVIGRTCAARVRIFDGFVDEGLELLDEVGALLMSGEVDPLTTGMMYCELICAAQGLALQGRANEWTEVMERWRHGAAFGGINGRCRVHRAEMLRLSGPCDLAEAEALKACDELRPWMRREFGWPLTELGNIRLRRGDLHGAEEAFLSAHDHAWSPQPGLALLRLAQGDVETASSMIADAIEHPFEIPSKERPPFGDLRLAPLLDAQAEIGAAAGDTAVVRSAADRLDTIADLYPSVSISACADLAHARAALLEGVPDDAIDLAIRAVVAWTDIGAPFETAVARTVLADAYAQSGKPELAATERQTAFAKFEDFGSIGWADRLAHLAGQVPPGEPLAAEERPEAIGTFRCDGNMWIVGYGDGMVHMRDLKGFRYIARMIAEPGREFHVLDLVAVERGTLPVAPAAGDDQLVAADGVGAPLPMIDEAARAAYRRRLAEVDDDIEDATRGNDLGRLELAQRDREYLVAELARAVGLGGRPRSTGGTAERARTSVTRSLRYAIARLAEHHPGVATHFEQSVHTGMYCVYSPDPFSPIHWER